MCHTTSAYWRRLFLRESDTKPMAIYLWRNSVLKDIQTYRTSQDCPVDVLWMLPCVPGVHTQECTLLQEFVLNVLCVAVCPPSVCWSWLLDELVSESSKWAMWLTLVVSELGKYWHPVVILFWEYASHTKSVLLKYNIHRFVFQYCRGTAVHKQFISGFTVLVSMRTQYFYSSRRKLHLPLFAFTLKCIDKINSADKLRHTTYPSGFF